MPIKKYLYSQFGRPRGPLGSLAGRIMSKRASNNDRSQWTVSLLNVQPTHRVLELGYGPGIGVAAVLAKLGDGGEVVGVDHSFTMQRMASRRLKRLSPERASHVRLMVADVASLPDGLGEFDSIFSCNVWLFWNEPVSVFQQLRSHLRRGGVVAVTHLPRHGNASAADTHAAGDKITEQLQAAGFSDIRREVLDLQPVPAVCVLATR